MRAIEGADMPAEFQTIMVNSPAGLFTAEQLKTVLEITANGSGAAKLTHTQRLAISIRPERIQEAEFLLKKAGLRTGAGRRGVKNIRACSGSHCERSVNKDAVSLCLEIDKQFYGSPAKFAVKIAISDCARNCAESYSADIGFIGINEGYRMVVGGRGARVPFRAFELVPRLDKTKIVAFLTNFLKWYNDNAEDGERLCKTLQRIGAVIFDAKSEEERSLIKSALENLDSRVRSGDGVSESARALEHYFRGLAVDEIRSRFADL